MRVLLYYMERQNSQSAEIVFDGAKPRKGFLCSAVTQHTRGVKASKFRTGSEQTR